MSSRAHPTDESEESQENEASSGPFSGRSSGAKLAEATKAPDEVLTSDPNPSQKQIRKSAGDRRGFLIRQLRGNGMLSLDRLNRSFNNPSRQVIDDDIEALREFGFNLEWVDVDGQRYLVDGTARHNGVKTQREMLHWRQKEVCGMVAASLILGLPPFGAQSPERETVECELASFSEDEERRERSRALYTPHLQYCLSQKDIIKCLTSGADEFATHRKLTQIVNYLRAMWSSTTRRVFVDSGTTNDRVAGFLKDVILPSPYSPLSGLNVCTNSRGIFETLGHFEVQVRAEVVGGSQLEMSETLVGPIAEASLANESLVAFSMAIIGATAIDVRRGQCFSDTPEERSVKEHAFARSHLKIVIADDSKLTTEHIRESYKFAEIIPEQIDLIITNHPIDDQGNTLEPEKLHRFNDAIQKIKSSGVPVLVGSLPKYAFTETVACGRELRCRLSNRLLERLRDDIKHSRNRQTDAVETFMNRLLTKYYEMKDFGNSDATNWIAEMLDLLSTEFEERGKGEMAFEAKVMRRRPDGRLS